MTLTAYDLAQRYIGIKEISGAKNHPLVSWWLSLCGFDLQSPDEIAWCSAFVNGIAWELRLPRSKSARARSWLQVGRPINLNAAIAGWDVVIFNRGGSPSPDVIDSPGHVAWFGRVEGEFVYVCGGNQSDSVSVARFPVAQVLGVRRLSEE